eukprot:3164792-Lingulodinium_polyedra.AAC.1
MAGEGQGYAESKSWAQTPVNVRPKGHGRTVGDTHGVGARAEPATPHQVQRRNPPWHGTA